jgi:streptogramin lyase
MRVASSPLLAVGLIAVVSLSQAPAPPGEPTTIFATPSQLPVGIAAGRAEDVFLVVGACCATIDPYPTARVVRVAPSGVISSVTAQPMTLSGDIAVDGFGNVLVAGWHNIVWRITRSGERSVFAQGIGDPGAIGVGPNGDVWVGDRHGSNIYHFDPHGALKEQVRVPHWFPVRAMAWSPSGDMYYIADTDANQVRGALYKLQDGVATRLWEAAESQSLDGMAFDRDGYLYLGTSGLRPDSLRGEIVLFDPQMQVVVTPFARVNRPPHPHEYPCCYNRVSLAFARDAQGNTTSRLLATTAEGVVELNPSGVRAPGWRVGPAEDPPAPPPLPAPPGEPTIGWAQGFGSGPINMAASSWDNQLFIADAGRGLIVRATPTSYMGTYLELPGLRDIAFDGLGDLLVATRDTIWRVAYGPNTVFALAQDANVIVLGPDADVWVGTASAILRFSPFGVPKGAVALGACTNVRDLAFSPGRELFFTSDGCAGVHKVVGNSTTPAITEPARPLGALAFDQNGWLWASDPERSAVLLFDAQYHLAHNPFATLSDAVGGLAFLRDPRGVMTPQLLASTLVGGRIVQMNPRGMGAPGWSVGGDLRMEDWRNREARTGERYVDTLRMYNSYIVRGAVSWSAVSGALPPGLTFSADGILSGTPLSVGQWTFFVRAETPTQFGLGRYTLRVAAGQTPPQSPPVLPSSAELARALLGVAGAGLTLSMIELLDQQGNRNGVLDIGDFRARLRVLGGLPSSTEAR